MQFGVKNIHCVFNSVCCLTEQETKIMTLKYGESFQLLVECIENVSFCAEPFLPCFQPNYLQHE